MNIIMYICKVTETMNEFCTIINKLMWMIFVVGCAKFNSYAILYRLIWMLLMITLKKIHKTTNMVSYNWWNIKWNTKNGTDDLYS